VDNGNNNGILSLARANYRPYGVDFPDGAAPPGRFTNGRTMVDLLADHLGFRPPLISAYAMAQPADHARGLNFASGAAGIRHETGNNLGGHYPLSEQVQHFHTVAQGLAPDKRQQLGQCIYYVGMGSNDYLNNYFMPESQITDLYALGARKCWRCNLAAPLLLPLNSLNLSWFSNTGAHTRSKEEQQSFAVVVFLGTYKGYIFFSFSFKTCRLQGYM
jgi:hypothetical protein